MKRFLVLLCALAALSAAQPALAKTILFVGNSFTYGELSPVKSYKANTVTDLNRSGIGGVPALFKAFAVQAGLDYDVSLETVPGVGLDYHYAEKRSLLDRRWDTAAPAVVTFKTQMGHEPAYAQPRWSAVQFYTQLFRRDRSL